MVQYRWSNVCVIGVPWAEETRKMQETIWRNGHTHKRVHTHTKAYHNQISDDKKILKAARETNYVQRSKE